MPMGRDGTCRATTVPWTPRRFPLCAPHETQWAFPWGSPWTAMGRPMGMVVTRRRHGRHLTNGFQPRLLVKSWSMTCPTLGASSGARPDGSCSRPSRSDRPGAESCRPRYPQGRQWETAQMATATRHARGAEEAIDNPWGEKPGHLPTSAEILGWLADADMIVISKRRLAGSSTS